MRAVEYSVATIQSHAYHRAASFRHIRAKLHQRADKIIPTDILVVGTVKDGFDGSSAFFIHRGDGTILQYHRQAS